MGNPSLHSQQPLKALGFQPVGFAEGNALKSQSDMLYVRS